MNAASSASRLAVLPGVRSVDEWIAPALFAARHGQSINVTYTARPDVQGMAGAVRAEQEALLAGAPLAGTAYLITDPSLAAAVPSGLNFRRIEQGTTVFLVPQ